MAVARFHFGCTVSNLNVPKKLREDKSSKPSSGQSSPKDDPKRKKEQVVDINDLLTNLRTEQVYDYLRIASNQDLRRFLATASKQNAGASVCVSGNAF